MSDHSWDLVGHEQILVDDWLLFAVLCTQMSHAKTTQSWAWVQD